MSNPARPKVVVVGAGFGGLFTVRGLADAPMDILIIEKNNYHTFVPLLYQVAAAELEPVEIAYPVRTITRRRSNLRFVMDEVVGIDLAKRCVRTPRTAFAYDYLVLAAGSVTNFFGMQRVARHAFGIKDLPEAVALRNHILESFERASRAVDPQRRQALLNFVVVGGGPTGVEFSATLAELIWEILRRDYPELPFDQVRIMLLEAADRLLPFLDPELSLYAQKSLAAKGVEVLTDTRVVDASPDSVQLADGTTIPAHTLVWTAGVKANPLADQLATPQGRGGRVKVTPALHLPGHPEVYVVGDMAYTEQEGAPVPEVAPAAIQQARTAAANIRRHLAGEPLRPFRYVDKGTMLTIGRSKGIAAFGRRASRGFFAWLIWLAVHIINLIGFRNRLYVLTGWAWSYIIKDRIRLIMKPPPPSTAHQEAVKEQGDEAGPGGQRK